MTMLNCGYVLVRQWNRKNGKKKMDAHSPPLWAELFHLLQQIKELKQMKKMHEILVETLRMIVGRFTFI